MIFMPYAFATERFWDLGGILDVLAQGAQGPGARKTLLSKYVSIGKFYTPTIFMKFLFMPSTPAGPFFDIETVLKARTLNI